MSRRYHLISQRQNTCKRFYTTLRVWPFFSVVFCRNYYFNVDVYFAASFYHKSFLILIKFSHLSVLASKKDPKTTSGLRFFALAVSSASCCLLCWRSWWRYLLYVCSICEYISESSSLVEHNFRLKYTKFNFLCICLVA